MMLAGPMSWHRPLPAGMQLTVDSPCGIADTIATIMINTDVCTWLRLLLQVVVLRSNLFDYEGSLLLMTRVALVCKQRGYEWAMFVDVDEYVTTRRNVGNTIAQELAASFSKSDVVRTQRHTWATWHTAARGGTAGTWACTE